MITKKKQRVLEGVQNNLFDKILGYPTVMLFSDLKQNTTYSIDFLKHTINPRFKDPHELLDSLFRWFDKEITDRRIDRDEILKCLLKVKVSRSKFLFFWYKTYNFHLKVKTSLKETSKSHSVRGWL